MTKKPERIIQRNQAFRTCQPGSEHTAKQVKEEEELWIKETQLKWNEITAQNEMQKKQRKNYWHIFLFSFFCVFLQTLALSFRVYFVDYIHFQD